MIEMFQKEEVLPYMRGLWREALQSVCGLGSEVFNKKHQACPHCGGKDRFRWTDKLDSDGDGGAVCNGCGNDKGVGWLMKLTGENYSECINILGRFLGKVPQEYIVKANARAKRDLGFKEVRRIDNEKAVDIMGRTTQAFSCELKLVEYLQDNYGYNLNFKHQVSVGFKDGVQTIAEPCRAVYADGVDPDEICNVAYISESGGTRFAAGGFTLATVCTIGESDGSIYLVADWLTGIHVHNATGQEVWVCFTEPNIEIVAFRYKGVRELRVACLPTDHDSLCSAEERGLKVILPIGKCFRNGAEKKLYDASDVLNI